MVSAFRTGLWLSFILRLLRSKPAPSTIKRSVLCNMQPRLGTSFLTRVLSCSSSRYIRTESMMRRNRSVAAAAAETPTPADSAEHSKDAESAISVRPYTNNYDYAIFESPSLSAVLANTLKFIKHASSAAHEKSLIISSEVNSAALCRNSISDENSSTGDVAGDVAASNPAGSRSGRFLWSRVRIATGVNLRTPEDIATFVDQLSKHDTMALASIQKPLEDLFLRYLRLHAPDSGVALSFLHAIDPDV